MPVALEILVGILLAAAGVVAVVFLTVPVFKGIGWFFVHIWRFIAGMLGDFVRAIGGIITSIVFIPIIVGNIAIGRWSASKHFGRALQDEIASVGHCFYRVLIGHPARLLLLHGLVEGLERRVPEAVAQAPGSDKPGKRTGQFEGYTIVGALQGGGSGGRLYVAEPDAKKRAMLARSGRSVDQVVIKSFSLADGSSLPQIIRESRALEAAKKLGLILDHELTDQRFFYVMEYIPGESLSVVTKRLHAQAGPDGLGQAQLASAISMVSDLLAELHRYHTGGLWHKDVKPDNIIVNQGKAHLVDLGLITPLRSAMTLTTHGTEYFRDPEMVRMALRGAKVSEVDGVKFDIYGAGAVLFSVIENSFPGHGGLSRLCKSCPEALRWVVWRAMTDLNKRYASAAEMLGDLRVILAAADPYMLKPIDLPSMRGSADPDLAPASLEPEPAVFQAAARTPQPPRADHAAAAQAAAAAAAANAVPSPGTAPAARRAPSIRVADWLTGKYESTGGTPGASTPGDLRGFAADAQRMAQDAAAAANAGINEAVRSMGWGAGAAPKARSSGTPAHEQLHRAQERVRSAQARIASKLGGASRRAPLGGSGDSPFFMNVQAGSRRFSTRPNAGVGVAFVAFMIIGVVIVIAANRSVRERNAAATAVIGANTQQQIDRAIAEMRTQIESGIADDFSAAVHDSIADVHDAVAQSALEIRRGNEAMGESGPMGNEKLAEANAVGEMLSDIVSAIKRSSSGSQSPVAPEAPTPPALPALPATVWMPGVDELGLPRPATAAEPVGQVLLLNMVPADLAEPNKPQLDGIERQLAAAGFEVLGGASSPVDTQTLAQAKRTIELSQPGDAEAEDRVRRWLRTQPATLSGVMWIGAGTEPGTLVWKLIDRRNPAPRE